MRIVGSSLSRAVDVVELLAEFPDGERLTAVADRLGLPKSVVHRLLEALCARGWAEQDAASGRYRLGMRLGLLGHHVFQASGFGDICQPVLARLAAQTRELVRMTLARGDGLVWAGSAQGAPPGLRYEPAMAGPVRLHATANGKAWLAALPEQRARAVLRGFVFERLTPKTIADRAALSRDLAATRARGWAIADEEAETGVVAIALAIPASAPGAPVPGTLSVAGPTARIAPARHAALARALGAAAGELARYWGPRTALARRRGAVAR
jgi:IclR family transcriptional regulator, acetate operon repressor